MDVDRAAGVLLGTACGDALGAGYEFGPPVPAGVEIGMFGGNGFGPGEWTDDTAMTVVVAQAAAAGLDLGAAPGLDRIAVGFLRWYRGGPVDVGSQTRRVLATVEGAAGESFAGEGASGEAGAGAAMSAASAVVFAANPGRGAGNGALMRTAPVALAYLHDPHALVRAALRVGELTHADPVSGEACALWSLAIRHAVLTGTFDGLRLGLAALPAERARYWSARLDEAEAGRPADFDRNGWVVQALQAAWSAIAGTPVPTSEPSGHLALALDAAVRGGRDADTVAAIAGGLLGARWGASAVPARWRGAIHGWPGLRADELVELAVGAARLR